MKDDTVYDNARILATKALAELAERKSDTLPGDQKIDSNIIACEYRLLSQNKLSNQPCTLRS